jgi:CheY-like chemotaxis protein
MKKEPSAPARILLVDDIASGLAARKLILMDHGYSVETAQSGEEAWEILQKNQFDVVVTDYRMREIDGLELIRRIRASGSPTRTVLLSGFLLPFNEQTSGADQVVQKSAREIPELLRVLVKLTARPRRRQAQSEKGHPPRRNSQAV